MKTVEQALLDEIYYPVNKGYVENKMIERGLDGGAEYSQDIAQSNEYKGCLADCLYSLIQAISISESDKSIGTLTDDQRKLILRRANSIYSEIGEDEKDDGEPTVEIMNLKTIHRPWQYFH